MAIDGDVIPVNPERYQFFQLVELLYRVLGSDIDTLLNHDPVRDPIRFIGNSSLAFATRDISSVSLTSEHIEIKVPFLTLTGTHSPLPNYYLEGFCWEELLETPRVVTLLNLFNHRLMTHLYKVWRKYRYFICFKANGQDQFSQKMFALVGLGSQTLRDTLHINPSKMLSYAGILANSVRSPALIAALIAHYFELDEVEILPWQPRRVAIAASQRNRIGIRNSTLGRDFIIGDHLADFNGKFILVIKHLSFEKMKCFLPVGSLFASLVNFVSFILRDRLAWDLRLVLANDQAKRMTIGTENESYLGWTCFLGTPPTDPYALITVQE